MEDIQRYQLPDEKAHMVQNFINKSKEALAHDSFWKNMTSDELDEATKFLEKEFMTRIYETYFFLFFFIFYFYNFIFLY